MKKLNHVISILKAEIEAALTPTIKKEICEEAKVLASSVLNGIWLELALIVIGDVEATIKA